MDFDNIGTYYVGLIYNLSILFQTIIDTTYRTELFIVLKATLYLLEYNVMCRRVDLWTEVLTMYFELYIGLLIVPFVIYTVCWVC